MKLHKISRELGKGGKGVNKHGEVVEGGQGVGGQLGHKLGESVGVLGEALDGVQLRLKPESLLAKVIGLQRAVLRCHSLYQAVCGHIEELGAGLPKELALSRPDARQQHSYECCLGGDLSLVQLQRARMSGPSTTSTSGG